MVIKGPLFFVTIIVVSVLLIACTFIGICALVFGGSNEGSPKLAEEWRAELSQYKDPVEAQSKNRDVIVIHFENGEWVFGLCQSSHGAWKRGGGTVVVKDSKGQVRVFFGHVCGEGALGAVWKKYSLDDYYRATLNEDGFIEHSFE